MTVYEKKKKKRADCTDDDAGNDKNKKRKTCTNGDASLSTIVRFTRLKLLTLQSKELLESLSSNVNLHSDKSSSSSDKNMIHTSKLLSKVCDKMLDKINELVFQNKGCFVVRRLACYSVARADTEMKRENKF